jgi:hypothetical protein
MTPDEVIFHRRVQCLAHASRTGNVSEACRVFGISRTTFYEWSNTAAAYGLEALMPKGRRVPQMPNATPTPVVADGCRHRRDTLPNPRRGLAVWLIALRIITWQERFCAF